MITSKIKRIVQELVEMNDLIGVKPVSRGIKLWDFLHATREWKRAWHAHREDGMYTAHYTQMSGKFYTKIKVTRQGQPSKVTYYYGRVREQDV